MGIRGVFKHSSLVGRRFGNLKVQREIRCYGRNRYKYLQLCRCSCGRTCKVGKFELLSGDTRSCGCFQRKDLAERSQGNSHGATHGMSGTATYMSWQAMKARCSNPNDRYWYKYGGAGVKVCGRWRDSFENFLADMGERLEGTTLGRYGDTGNYCKSNCSWQSPSEQGQEKSKKMAVAA